MTTTTTSSTASANSTVDQGGKYLTFVLGQESYGVAVLKVREIIRLTTITAVPRMPTYFKGVINLRGKIIPVVDLRIKFALGDTGTTTRTCIVVVQVAGPSAQVAQAALVGLLVDAVEEVLNIGPDEIEPTPDFGGRLETSHVLGLAKTESKVTTLLDIDRVLASVA